jgi:hypothetical protein
MRNLLYAIVLIFITAWSIGFIGYGMGGIMHILLVIAVIVIIFRLILDRKAI